MPEPQLRKADNGPRRAREAVHQLRHTKRIGLGGIQVQRSSAPAEVPQGDYHTTCRASGGQGRLHWDTCLHLGRPGLLVQIAPALNMSRTTQRGVDRWFGISCKMRHRYPVSYPRFPQLSMRKQLTLDVALGANHEHQILCRCWTAIMLCPHGDPTHGHPQDPRWIS